jgi:hypothetical protein
VGEIRLVLKRIRLRQYAAVGVPQQRDPAELQRLANGLHILHHVLHRVLGGVFELLGAAGAALVDENQPG